MDCFMDCLAIAAKKIMHLSLTKRAVIKMRNQLKNLVLSNICFINDSLLNPFSPLPMEPSSAIQKTADFDSSRNTGKVFLGV